MSTEKKTEILNEAQQENNVIVTYEDINSVNENSLKGFLLTTEQMTDIAIDQMIIQTIGSDESLDQKIESYNALMIKGIEDMVSYKMVDAAIKEIKKLRTSIAKVRLEFTRPADAYREKLIEAERTRIDRLKTLEAKLISDKQKIDDAIKAKREAVFIERSQKLHEVGYTIQNNLFVLGAFHIPSEQLSDMNEDEFERYMEHGRDEMKRREAEAQAIKEAKEQAERQAKLLEEERLQLQNERKKIADELELMRQERAKMALEMEDLNLQKLALEQTYDAKTEVNNTTTETSAENQNFETPEQKNIKSFSEKPQSVSQNPTTFINPVGEDMQQMKQAAQGENSTNVVNTQSENSTHSEPTPSTKPTDKTSASYIIGFNAVKNSILEAFKNPEFKSRINLIAGANDSLQLSIQILNSATSRVELFKAIEGMNPDTTV